MKINILLTITFLSILIYANINEMHGIVGLTKKDGGLGCLCHDIFPADSVLVWIEGPDTVLINDTVQFKLMMTGGPSIAGGFNIATYFGAVDSVDTLTKVMFGELTHTQPNLFKADTVSWNFLYIAPDSILVDTIYSVGNSVNLDSIPDDFDKWNFGENFSINVIDNPVFVMNEKLNPEEFVLYQNYPNPFNPITNFEFRIADFGFVSLKLFDVLGKEITTLVDEEKPAGFYELTYNASNLSSGIYYYRLEANGFVQTKKMVLLK